MMKLIYILAFAFFASIANADEIAVIVHPSSSAEISPKQLQRIFLGKGKTFTDGKRLAPIYLPSGNETREKFEKQALRKSSAQLKSYWAQLVFTGRGKPPKELQTIEEVLTKVANSAHAIAYIPASAVTDKVKVIAKY